MVIGKQQRRRCEPESALTVLGTSVYSYQANRQEIARRMGLNASREIRQAPVGFLAALRALNPACWKARNDFDVAAINFAGRGGRGLYETMTQAALRYVRAATGMELGRDSVESDWKFLPAGPADDHPPGQVPQMYADYHREVTREVVQQYWRARRRGDAVPHPLDVNIRDLPHDVLEITAGGREVTAYVAACPDGCGLVAWMDTVLPFNASDRDEVQSQITSELAR